MSEPSSETSLEQHNKKISKLLYSVNLIYELIEADTAFQDFGGVHKLNPIWITYKIKAINNKHFIITPQQFLDLCHEPHLNNTLDRLFYLLVDLKFLRKIEDDQFLVAEKTGYYCEMLRKYSLEDLSYCDIYAGVDELPALEAIEWYKNKHEEDPMFSSDAFCKHFGYEVEEFTIMKG